MNDFTIDGFWKKRLPERTQATAASVELPVNGWIIAPTGISKFVEAPLKKSSWPKEGNNDPATCSVILVAAPGAVGKSTLAKEIASKTAGVLFNLAEAVPVGGSTLTGVLYDSGLMDAWQNEEVAVLIDGLDEAKLKTSQEAFEAFLSNVVSKSKERNVPTILFGRTGAVEDAWLVISDEMPVSVLEIGYFERSSAIRFACNHYTEIPREKPSFNAAKPVIEKLIDRLRKDTQLDGNRFAGYAPVLEAVAERVADKDNLARLSARIDDEEQEITLQAIVDGIMKREQEKLNGLNLEKSLKGKLYTKKEQLDRLVALLNGQSYQEELPKSMKPDDITLYRDKVDEWLRDHPFIIDAGIKAKAANAVFEAVISMHALSSSENKLVRETELEKQLVRGRGANPFIFDFYRYGDNSDFVPPELIGVVYASFRARFSPGDRASLTIEETADEEASENSEMNIEIDYDSFDDESVQQHAFKSNQNSVIKLGSYVEAVQITASESIIEICGGSSTKSEAVLVAPVSIECQKIIFLAKNLSVEGVSEEEWNFVDIEAGTAEDSLIAEPSAYENVGLSVSWPEAEKYPWNRYYSKPIISDVSEIDEALRRFRKFIIAFNSGYVGGLTRSKNKIEGKRMTKDSGQAVLNHLVARGVLKREGSKYKLLPEKLTSETGMSYHACFERMFETKAIDFVAEAIKHET